MVNDKRKILIVEDAEGVATMYKELLPSEYQITVCPSGLAAQSLIDKGEKFDLAIMDVVLPPEDMKRFTLDDCQKTGLRLMQAMIQKNMCSRFYVITVRKELKEEVEAVCKEAHTVVRFEYKLDTEPEELAGNIKCLLEQEAK